MKHEKRITRNQHTTSYIDIDEYFCGGKEGKSFVLL